MNGTRSNVVRVMIQGKKRDTLNTHCHSDRARLSTGYFPLSPPSLLLFHPMVRYQPPTISLPFYLSYRHILLEVRGEKSTRVNWLQVGWEGRRWRGKWEEERVEKKEEKERERRDTLKWYLWSCRERCCFAPFHGRTLPSPLVWLSVKGRGNRWVAVPSPPSLTSFLLPLGHPFAYPFCSPCLMLFPPLMYSFHPIVIATHYGGLIPHIRALSPLFLSIEAF